MNEPAAALFPTDLCARIDRDGFAVLRQVLSGREIEQILCDLEGALRSQSEVRGSIRSSRALVYAARNLLSIWPRALELGCNLSLRQSISAVLGSGCGLVRGLFFDKPPGRSWSLPWHKDMTIAVRDNRLPSDHFCKPTTKAGVPHVEAPECVLDTMLTARIHLDDVTDENGPLLVVPGSHRTGKRMCDARSTRGATPKIHPVLVSAGDVLLIRPLVIHSSGNSREGTQRHRRIVHLEFAGAPTLPDGYHWHDFMPLAED